jgi:hypothetical protein
MRLAGGIVAPRLVRVYQPTNITSLKSGIEVSSLLIALHTL